MKTGMIDKYGRKHLDFSPKQLETLREALRWALAINNTKQYNSVTSSDSGETFYREIAYDLLNDELV